MLASHLNIVDLSITSKNARGHKIEVKDLITSIHAMIEVEINFLKLRELGREVKNQSSASL